MKNNLHIIYTQSTRQMPLETSEMDISGKMLLLVKELSRNVCTFSIFFEKTRRNIKMFILRRSGLFSSFLQHITFVLHDFFTENQNFDFFIFLPIIKGILDTKKSMDFHWFSLTFNDFHEFQWIFMNFNEFS